MEELNRPRMSLAWETLLPEAEQAWETGETNPSVENLSMLRNS